MPNHIGLGSLGRSGWAPLYRDSEQEVLLVHQQTGAVREAPWLALRTTGGNLFFANLVHANQGGSASYDEVLWSSYLVVRDGCAEIAVSWIREVPLS